MITASKVLSEMPPLVDMTNGESLTITAISKNEIERRILSSESAPTQLVTAGEKKGSVVRKLIKLTAPHVHVNSDLQLENPYDITTHIVVTYDERYASHTDIEAAIAQLFTWCLSRENATSLRNVMRVAVGEL